MTRISYGCAFTSLLLVAVAVAIRDENYPAARLTAWVGVGIGALGCIAMGIEWWQHRTKPQHRKRNQ